MKDGHASTTALAVAIARGVGSPAFEPDRTAPRILWGLPAVSLRAWQALPVWLRGRGWGPRVLSAGLVDHVSLRSAAIDAAVRRAVRNGAAQLVLLGAGYDGRAWRLDALRDVAVFEVDHPATAAQKQARTRGFEACAASVTYVSVNFGEQSVAQRLGQAGHRADVPTCWVWEGVTPYLPPTATEATLADVAERSASGSAIAVTYGRPDLAGAQLPLANRAILRAFAGLGEPLLGLMSRNGAAALARRHGFEPASDTGQREWAAQTQSRSTLARPFRAERLLEAYRD